MRIELNLSPADRERLRKTLESPAWKAWSRREWKRDVARSLQKLLEDQRRRRFQ